MSIEQGGISTKDVDAAIKDLQKPEGRFYAAPNGTVHQLKVTHQASVEAHLKFEQWLAQNGRSESQNVNQTLTGSEGGVDKIAKEANSTELATAEPVVLVDFQAQAPAANPAEGPKPA